MHARRESWDRWRPSGSLPVVQISDGPGLKLGSGHAVGEEGWQKRRRAQDQASTGPD